jgi:hypothetical protein
MAVRIWVQLASPWDACRQNSSSIPATPGVSEFEEVAVSAKNLALAVYHAWLESVDTQLDRDDRALHRKQGQEKTTTATDPGSRLRPAQWAGFG